MTPTESAIKNRIKEAFALKISEDLWDIIMESLQPQLLPVQDSSVDNRKVSELKYVPKKPKKDVLTIPVDLSGDSDIQS